jgi:hypothetical protein
MKKFTGVVPIRHEGTETIQCEPHRAHGWMPLIAGAPIKASGHVLRYVSKRDALAALATALARRSKPSTYTLGARMAPRSRPILTISTKGNEHG